MANNNLKIRVLGSIVAGVALLVITGSVAGVKELFWMHGKVTDQDRSICRIENKLNKILCKMFPDDLACDAKYARDCYKKNK